MKHLFSNLAWYNRTEYFIFLLMTASVAIEWHWGIWALALLLLNTIAKGIATGCWRNHRLRRVPRICLWLMVALYGVYALSSIYSSNPHEAWTTTLPTMLPLVMIPLAFLCSNHSYLRRRHFDGLVFLLALCLTLRFAIMLTKAAIGYCHGTQLNELIDFHFDPLHHNYLAMYLLAAVALLYAQLSSKWSRPRWRHLRWAVIADMMLLTLYMVIMGSRSGLVIFALLAAAWMAHLSFVRRQWVATGLIAAALAVMVAASYIAMPRLYWRIIYSAQQMASGAKGDSRQTIWACGLEVLKGHEALGLGCDGYWDQLHQSYVDHNFAEGFLHEQYNTHNQYLETTLCTGIFGLLILLSIIAVPLVFAIRKTRNLPFVLFTIVYAGSLFFEVTLARQMGLLFVLWWYCLLIDAPAKQGAE